MHWCPMTLMRLMSAPLEFPRCPQTGASFHCLPVFCGDSGGALFCRQTETILWPLCVCPAHSECSAAFPAAGHSSYFSSRPDVAVIYRRSSSAVGSSNGREPKSASEKYDQPAELRLNVDSNQLQLLMSQSKGFFNIFSPPLPFHLCWVLMWRLRRAWRLSAGITIQTDHLPGFFFFFVAGLVIYVADVRSVETEKELGWNYSGSRAGSHISAGPGRPMQWTHLNLSLLSTPPPCQSNLMTSSMTGWLWNYYISVDSCGPELID